MTKQFRGEYYNTENAIFERKIIMKKWQRYFGVVLFLVLWLIPVITSAEERKDEWKQQGYSFGQMKLVLVQTSFTEKVQADDLKRRILYDKVQTTFSKNLKFAQAGLSFWSEAELVQRLSKTSGEDVAAIAQSDPERYKKLIQEGGALYCQGILQVRFSVYEDTVRRIPERTEIYQTIKKVYVNKEVIGSDGRRVTVKEWVEMPVTESRVMPAYDEITAHTALELTLLDAKTQQPVWKMIDSRDAVGREKDGMIDRTLKRAAERFEAIKKLP